MKAPFNTSHRVFFIAVAAYLLCCLCVLLYFSIQWVAGVFDTASHGLLEYTNSISEEVVTPKYTVLTGALMVATGTVMHVRDGDTVEVRLDGADVPIRLIGVDTPESVHPNKLVECFGPESSRFTKRFLGQDVLLWRDPTQDAYDTYGRMLAYVGLPDGRILNGLLIETGNGKEYTYQRRQYLEQERYLELEREAKATLVGLWGGCE